jgi:hypothetical protein
MQKRGIQGKAVVKYFGRRSMKKLILTVLSVFVLGYSGQAHDPRERVFSQGIESLTISNGKIWPTSARQYWTDVPSPLSMTATIFLSIDGVVIDVVSTPELSRSGPPNATILHYDKQFNLPPGRHTVVFECWNTGEIFEDEGPEFYFVKYT